MKLKQEEESKLQRRIYVGSLHYELSEDHIRVPFSAFGTITRIDMPREGNRSKGFCFVEYATVESALTAMRTNNQSPSPTPSQKKPQNLKLAHIIT